MKKICLVIGLIGSLFFNQSCLDDNGVGDLPLLWELIEANSDYSIAATAFELTEIDASLKGNINFTVFVPNNAAFTTFLQENNYGTISDVPPQLLSNIMTYHLQVGAASERDIAENFYGTSSPSGPNGAPLAIYFSLENSGIVINGDIEITKPDTRARNGYIHEIEEVISLPDLRKMLGVNENSEDFLRGLSLAGLMPRIDDNEPLTLFVPTTPAFEQYFDMLGVSSLDDLPTAEVESIIKYHVSPGNKLFSDFINGFQDIETLSPGEELRIGVTDGIMIFSTNDASTILSDVQATNGVIHFIDRVLVPQ